MTTLRIFKIAESARVFMKTRSTQKEQQEIYDGICALAHKVRPYRASDGITRVAPQYFKYTFGSYTVDFEDANDGCITIAKIAYKEPGYFVNESVDIFAGR